MSTRTRTREVAVRLFAREFSEADHMFREDDDEYAPSYLLLPSGDKANRIFVVGTLTENEDKGDYYSARVNDGTGNFFIYAGQYQPEAADALRNIEAPAYVAVVAKPNTYETDDGDTLTNLRPEIIVEVDEDIRNKWVAETAEDTLDRLSKTAEDNVYAKQADEHYGTERIDLVDDVIESLEHLEATTE